MAEETSAEENWEVTILFQVRQLACVVKNACLRRVKHTLSDFAKDIAIFD